MKEAVVGFVVCELQKHSLAGIGSQKLFSVLFVSFSSKSDRSQPKAVEAEVLDGQDTE